MWQGLKTARERLWEKRGRGKKEGRTNTEMKKGRFILLGWINGYFVKSEGKAKRRSRAGDKGPIDQKTQSIVNPLPQDCRFEIFWKQSYKVTASASSSTWKLGIFSFRYNHASRPWMLWVILFYHYLADLWAYCWELILSYSIISKMWSQLTHPTTPHLYDSLRLPNCICSLLPVHP